MLVFSSFSPFASASDICSEYHLLNFYFMYCLKWSWTVRSKGWKMWIIFAGTLTRNILLRFNFSRTFSVICSRKTSIISRDGWSCGRCSSFLFLVRYGTMISSIILRASAVLLKRFGFMLSENEFGKSKRGKLWTVVPW